MLVRRSFHPFIRCWPQNCGRRNLTVLVVSKITTFRAKPGTLFGISQPQELNARRNFAKRAKRNAVKADIPLANEQLVAELMKRAAGASAEEIRVRVRDADSTTSVVSLKEAINMSVEASSDLVALAIDQEVPVITISDFGEIVYNQNKKSSTKQNGKTTTKEVTFKVAIAENDFQRKLDSVIKFLGKGHNCSVSVKALRRHMTANPNIAEETGQKVLGILKEHAEVQKHLQMNEGKNLAQFQLRPKKSN